ncbi:NADH-quinone oxidoreductase subunit C [bacterium]|nr:NADH-quinone oxidoreductase subunit C [bacterium]
MNKELLTEILATFKKTQGYIEKDNRLFIETKKEIVPALLKYFKDKSFDRLAMVSCVDRINENKLEIIYILTSFCLDNPLNIILKIKISRNEPELDTVIPIFENAEPYEREIHELFGVDFIGHPRLTPLFLEREYEIPPFRKDFDMRKYSEELFDSVPFVGDEK